MNLDLDELDALPPRLRGPMVKAAEALNRALNLPFADAEDTTGFIILVFPFGEEEGRCHLLTNARREEIAGLLLDQAEAYATKRDRQ